MLRPIALICSDVHLQPHVWTHFPDMAGDTYDAFDEIIALANEQKVPVFCAGDLFDKRRCDTYSLERFSGAVAALDNPFFYIQGNHDNTDPPWPQVCSASVHLHGKVRTLLGASGKHWRIGGLDFQRADQLPSAIDAIYAYSSEIDVLIMHQAWDEIQRVGSTQGSIATLLGPSHLPILVTGDYHKRMTIPVGVTTVHSPGSTSMQAIDEESDKYVTLLCEEYGDRAEPRLVLRDIKLASARPCHRHVIRTVAELDALIGNYGSDIPASRRPLVHVTYVDALPEVLPRLLAGVGTKAYLFLKAIRFETTTEVQVSASPESKLTIGMALRELEKDPDVLQLAFAVESVSDVTAVLTAEREKFVADWKLKHAVA
jgi:DNA repair exonuclease SbcCD nuclease subunit